MTTKENTRVRGADKKRSNDKGKYPADYIFNKNGRDLDSETEKIRISDAGDALAEMEAALNDIVDDNPRIDAMETHENKALEDIRAVLQVSLAVNSSLVLHDILQIVMKKAIELLKAERGFIMLLDPHGKLQFKTAHNIDEEQIQHENFKISNSIANQVADTGKSVYTSDALSDERFAEQQSILELHLRSIMCVPLKIKNRVIGLIYLDNSSEARLFLKADLFLLELYGQQAVQAIHNAKLYDQLLILKKFSEKVINNTPVGVVVIDSSCNTVSINDAALAILEKNKNEVSLLGNKRTPTNFLDIIPRHETKKWRKMIDTALANNQSFDDSRYFHNTGYNEKVLSIKISPIKAIPYGGDGLILVIEDITEKIIMEKYVILSEKLVARGEMAASIGHELNNYLAIIANNAELLSLNLERDNSDRAKSNARQILDSISRMKRFTDGLMDFSKLETDFISYNVNHLIEELLFSLKAQSRFKNIMFSVDLEGALPDIEIDVGQIQQVLLNILNNAADALLERNDREKADGNNSFKRRIKLGAAQVPGKSQVKISISDNGPGIPQDVMPKLFQLHFTTKSSGHGLGLANCKKIVDSHHGTISLTSKENDGTTFTIILPEKQVETVS